MTDAGGMPFNAENQLDDDSTSTQTGLRNNRFGQRVFTPIVEIGLIPLRHHHLKLSELYFQEATMKRNRHFTEAAYFPQFVLFLLVLLRLAQPAIAADPDYSGDFLKRLTLTGDWGGARNSLAKKGVTFDINLAAEPAGSGLTFGYLKVL
jgi:hypothetical protein